MKKIFAIAIALIALVGANALYVNAKTTKTEVVPMTYAASTSVLVECNFCIVMVVTN